MMIKGVEWKRGNKMVPFDTISGQVIEDYCDSSYEQSVVKRNEM